MSVRVAVLAADRFKKRFDELKGNRVWNVVLGIYSEGDTRPLTELCVLFEVRLSAGSANFQWMKETLDLSEQ